ncbi:MAG: glycosyltransferase family 1 protein, partial [Bacteroidia bacterium]|nr:glycosyltransferase family 1 protein [Bacteroidia bacterium]
MPWPADYGGVIDVFYKLKELKKAGVKIYLHCFEYGRKQQKELEKYCEKVFYYKRKKSVIQLFSELPFIVKSRINEDLKKNLLSNEFPILFEGLHTCFLIADPAFKNRLKIFRESNIEHEYYRHLALSEKNPLKKNFYTSEAKKLEKFEKVLSNANLMLIVSETETEYFKKKFPKNKV